jgi:hypothetical protein
LVGFPNAFGRPEYRPARQRLQGTCVSSKVRLEVKPMGSLRQFLLAIAALLLSACGTGYAYNPSSVNCNDRANYSSCHWNSD